MIMIARSESGSCEDTLHMMHDAVFRTGVCEGRLHRVHDNAFRSVMCEDRLHRMHDHVFKAYWMKLQNTCFRHVCSVLTMTNMNMHVSM